MGNYTKNLFKNRTIRQQKEIASKKSTNSPHLTNERLVACAIIRNGETHSYGVKSHADIRRELKDENPYISTVGDEEGFMTSTDRFVGRYEANVIGAKAGQCVRMDRKFLSSDIDKW